MNEKNLCDTCYRAHCMLHPDRVKVSDGKIKFRMMECQSYLTDCIEIPEDIDVSYTTPEGEVHEEGGLKTIIENEWSSNVHALHLKGLNLCRAVTALRALTKDMLIECKSHPDGPLADALAGVISKHIDTVSTYELWKKEA